MFSKLCIDKQIMSSSLFTILLPDEIKKFTKKMPISSPLLKKPRLVKKAKRFL